MPFATCSTRGTTDVSCSASQVNWPLTRPERCALQSRGRFSSTSGGRARRATNHEPEEVKPRHASALAKTRPISSLISTMQGAPAGGDGRAGRATRAGWRCCWASCLGETGERGGGGARPRRGTGSIPISSRRGGDGTCSTYPAGRCSHGGCWASWVDVDGGQRAGAQMLSGKEVCQATATEPQTRWVHARGVSCSLLLLDTTCRSDCRSDDLEQPPRHHGWWLHHRAGQRARASKTNV